MVQSNLRQLTIDDLTRKNSKFVDGRDDSAKGMPNIGESSKLLNAKSNNAAVLGIGGCYSTSKSGQQR